MGLRGAHWPFKSSAASFLSRAPVKSDTDMCSMRCSRRSADDHMDDHGGQPGPAPEGSAGRSENLQGGVQRKDTGGTRPYREDPALQGRTGPTAQGRRGPPIACDVINLLGLK